MISSQNYSFMSKEGVFMKQWFVAHTQPRAEEVAVRNLLNQGYEVFLPRYHRVRRHARKMGIVLSPLFPRYLFISLDLEIDRWLSIESTRGVAYIVRQNGGPVAVPVGMVEELKSRSDNQEIVSLSSLEVFKQGCELEILEGVFSGYVGIYEKMTDDDRVQLLLNFLGRTMKMAVSIHNVSAVA